MRKIYLATVLSLVVVLAGFAQSVPQGMNYQAVARDKAGKELINQQISLQISLYSPVNKNAYYTETHSVTTNEFGLFTLVIGEGTAQSGAFSDIPWSQEEIWMSVSIQMPGQQDYSLVGSSKLYTVPYAFYAGSIANTPGKDEKSLLTNTGQCPCNGGITSLSVLYLGPSGVTIRVYNNASLQNNGLVATFSPVNNGAVLTINVPQSLGTLQSQTYFQYSGIPNAPPVTAVPTVCSSSYTATNPASPGGTWGNISVVSQTDQNGETCTACNVSGLWYVGGNAVLAACNKLGTLSNNDLVLISNNTPRMVISAAGDVTVDNNLNVNEGLNVLGNVKLNQSSGTTTNNGPFTVANFSPTTLTGTLTTNGATQLNSTLTVTNATNLNGNLNVNDQRPTNLTGTLTVARETKLDSSLAVAGNSDFHGFLHVDNRAPAVFTGTLQGYENATFNDQVLITDAAINSSNTSTGALVVAGGTGIGQTLYVGGPSYLLSTLSVAGNSDLFGYLHVNNASPTLLTGTLSDSLNATFFQHVTLPNGNLQSLTPFDGALVVAGGIGVEGNLNVGGSASFGGPVNFKSVVSFTDTLNSTSYNNGTIVVVGGVGIGKRLNVDGAVHFNSTLETDGATTLESTLGVNGNTDLHGHLNVDNNQPTTLSGTLTVDQAAQLNSTLGVSGNSNLNGTLTVGQATQLNSTLTVSGNTTLNGSLTENGRFVVNSNQDANGDHTAINAYPVQIKGSKQGIIINLTGNSGGVPDMTNNYLLFLDANNTIRGSISGETIADLSQDQGYEFNEGFYAANLAIVTAQLAQAVAQQIASDASTTPCVGLGVCETAPIPSFIASSAFNLGIAAANEVIAAEQITLYTTEYQSNIGVIFNSGSGDYAEWLPKADPNEKMYRGDVVGVKGGFVSKSTEGAEKLMVISDKPIVLGNTPPAGKEGAFAKVAFMGQVPVKVLGAAEPGDYILNSATGNGFGVAKHAKDMEASDYLKIVGTAWEGSKSSVMNMINTAIGINTNDVARVAVKQEEKLKAQDDEINALKKQMAQANDALSKLVPGFAAPAAPGLPAPVSGSNPAVSENNLPKLPTAIHYHEPTREEIEEGLVMAAEKLRNSGQTAKNNPFLKKLEGDPAFKENLILQIQEKCRKQIEKNKEIDAAAPINR